MTMKWKSAKGQISLLKLELEVARAKLSQLETHRNLMSENLINANVKSNQLIKDVKMLANEIESLRKGLHMCQEEKRDLK